MAGKNVAGQVLKVETVPKEQQAEARKAVAQSREAGQQRQQTEAKILASGAAPVKANDPPKAVKMQVPRTTPLAPNGPKAAPPPQPPPAPQSPAHVEKPIPPHEPPAPAKPPASHPLAPAPHPAPPPPAAHPAPPPPHPAPPPPRPQAGGRHP